MASSNKQMVAKAVRYALGIGILIRELSSGFVYPNPAWLSKYGLPFPSGAFNNETGAVNQDTVSGMLATGAGYILPILMIVLALTLLLTDGARRFVFLMTIFCGGLLFGLQREPFSPMLLVFAGLVATLILTRPALVEQTAEEQAPALKEVDA